MNSKNVDSALINAYTAFDKPVDQFFGDVGLVRDFTDEVARRLDGSPVDSQAIMKRLLNLRKNGRLPRLRRAFHGRKSQSRTD